MKAKFAKFIAPLAALALFATGCTTTPQNNSGPVTENSYTPDDLRADIDAAVGVAASLRLAGHPERRPAWESAQRGLATLVESQKWSVQSFVEAFAVSGADKVQNQKVQLAIENGLAVVTLASRRRINMEDPVWARAVIEGANTAILRVLRTTASAGISGGLRHLSDIDSPAIYTLEAKQTVLTQVIP